MWDDINNITVVVCDQIFVFWETFVDFKCKDLFPARLVFNEDCLRSYPHISLQLSYSVGKEMKIEHLVLLGKKFEHIVHDIVAYIYIYILCIGFQVDIYIPGLVGQTLNIEKTPRNLFI